MINFNKSLTTGLFAICFCVAGASADVGDADIAGGSADPDFEGNAGAIIINGLTLTKRQDLHFGTIAPNMTEFGSVSVRRGSNNSSICGTNLVCLENGTRARFTVTGTPLQHVNILDPGSIQITDGSGNFMTVDTFVGAGSGNDTEWRGWQRLRSSGISRFNVGATLEVKPNQPRGSYTGTFTITVEYQ
ncbi:MAG: DUF4402 domain-containing protein [Henriciella sp.]|nr:DUF4402 domain-containing protein [Henriciella sp.]